MRPIYLEMSAWGPYKDVVHIDFEAFESGALFLIAGPTGSGKTTIFDGICFGIYGNTSGKEREKTTLRSDFAGPDSVTYVDLKFRHNGLIYRVYRNPEYLRPKKRKNADGQITYTREKENAILYLPDGNVLEGVTAVNQKLTEIMRLDYSQFKQISMIAQGEFDRLLTAPSQEKNKIFRGIFGTEKYDLFTQALKQRSAESYRKYREYTHKIEEDIRIYAKGEPELEAMAMAEHMQYDAIESYMAERLNVYGKELEESALLLQQKDKLVQQKQAAYQQLEQREALEKQYVQAKERLEKLMATQNQYEAAREAVSKNREAKSLEALYSEKERAKAQASKYEKLLKAADGRLEEAKQIYLKAEQAERESYEAWQQADNRYKRAAVGIVADMLSEGKPCPVCGSLDHPNPFKAEGKVPDAGEVERLKKLQEQSQSAKVLAYGQVQAGLERQRAIRKDLEQAQEEAVKGRNLWRKELAESSFVEEQAFLLARLTKAQEEKFLDRISKWEEMVTSTRAVMEHLEGELQQKGPLDKAQITLDYQNALTELNEARNRERTALVAKTRMEQGILSIKENKVQASKYEKEYGIVKDLENLATGNNTRRLIFEQFVLRSFFEDILAAANIRFRHMTFDRYEMVRKAEVTDARTKDHLDIAIVDYYTGKTRPVSTLSGGERFHASLSLALGMSDVIQAYQGGVQVETLFVDEGFGSLDEESLQAACDSLYQLTRGDKLVGIISHIESLRQRIDNRIEICKTNMGSSLRVISQN